MLLLAVTMGFFQGENNRILETEGIDFGLGTYDAQSVDYQFCPSGCPGCGFSECDEASVLWDRHRVSYGQQGTGIRAALCGDAFSARASESTTIISWPLRE